MEHNRGRAWADFGGDIRLRHVKRMSTDGEPTTLRLVIASLNP